MTTTLLFSLSKIPDLYFCILAQNGIENVELPLGRAVVVIITENISVSINLEIHYKVWHSDLVEAEHLLAHPLNIPFCLN